MEKAQAEATLRVLCQHLAARYEKDQLWTRRFKVGDDSAIDELVSLACRDTGVSPFDYQEAFERDAGLQLLQKLLIGEIIIGPLDPHRESLGARAATRRPWWKFW